MDGMNNMIFQGHYPLQYRITIDQAFFESQNQIGNDHHGSTLRKSQNISLVQNVKTIKAKKM